MAAENKKDIELEIAHVLFLDIVGYSKLSANEQHVRISELNEVVRLSEQFRKAEADNRILKIPTGDGMALVFYKSSGRIPGPGTQRNRSGKSVRQNSLRPALAALPAQNRQGPRPARQDRVQGDANPVTTDNGPLTTEC